MSEAAAAELRRDGIEQAKALAALTEALRGHIEFCIEDRRREAETRERLDRQFGQLMQQLAEVDNRRRAGMERLHARQDEEVSARVEALAEVKADQTRWRESLLHRVLGVTAFAAVVLGSALVAGVVYVAQRIVFIGPAPPPAPLP